MTTFLLRLCLVLLVTLGAARAEPYLAVDRGLKCVACHVNPTGGGLRNAFGAAFTQTTLAARPLPEGWPVWTGGFLDNRLRVGTDLRASWSRTTVSGQPAQTERGLDQWRVYVDAQLWRDVLGVSLDEQVRPGKPVRQEAYARLSTRDGRWLLKAGQFYLPFGWRLQDQTAFVRSASGINMTAPDKGFEVGLELDTWSVQFAHSNGPGNVGPTTGNQNTLQAVYVQPDWRLGFGHARTQSSAGDRDASTVFGGWSTGPLAWLAEVDWIADGAFPEGKRRLLAGLAEVNWKVAQGHNLKFTSELLDPDRAVSNDHKVRHSLVYELTPVPFLQLRTGYRRNGGIPQNAFDNRRSVFVELHAFM